MLRYTNQVAIIMWERKRTHPGDELSREFNFAKCII